MAGAGLIGLPGGEECFPGTIERLSLAAAVADFLVERQRLLVVSGGLVMVPLLVADLAESAESAGLFPRVAGSTGEGERSGEAVAGLGVLAGGEQGFPGVVDCRGLELAVADLLVQSQGLALVGQRLVMLALPVANSAQRDQRVGLTDAVADLAGGGEGLLRVVGGLLVLAEPPAGLAEVAQRFGLTVPVTGLPGHRESLSQLAGGLRITALPQVALAQATQGFGLPGLVFQLAKQGEGLAEAASAVLVASLEKLGYC
jgi:hypothetical protein